MPVSPAFDIIQSHVQPSLSPCSTSPSTSGEENEYGVKMQKSEVAKPGSAALLKEGKSDCIAMRLPDSVQDLYNLILTQSFDE